MSTPTLASNAVAQSPNELNASKTQSNGKRTRKKCSKENCDKVDAGGGYCVGHGGGKKCSFTGCTKGSQTGGYCRQHGGGARCQVIGCSKVDAGKGLCRAHGGGRRCQALNCPKADVGGGYCTVHGGGKRCTEPGCVKIDQGGGKCRAHGGSRRCRKPGCSKPARGARGCCRDHGGSRICSTPNCRRLVKGKTEILCGGCRAQEDNEEINLERRIGLDSTLIGAELLTLNKQQSIMIENGVAKSMRRDDMSDKKDNENIQPGHIDSRESIFDTGLVSGLPMKSCCQKEVATSSSLDEVAKPLLNEYSGIGSCLEHGCSRSFGGVCNCAAESCACCHRESPKRPLMPTEGIEDSNNHIKRRVFQVHTTKNVASILPSLLASIKGVRSAHEVPTNSTPSPKAEKNESMLVVLRYDSLDQTHFSELMSEFNIKFRVIEESSVHWRQIEVLLLVEGMRCPGNCGNSVLRALKMVPYVKSADMIFEQGLFIVRGNMSAKELCDKVSLVGFSAIIKSVVPIPNRFRFQCPLLKETSFTAVELSKILKYIEGVEMVDLNVHTTEILVVATLENSTHIRDKVIQYGYILNETYDVEVQSVETNTEAAQYIDKSVNSEISIPNAHQCDMEICAANQCEQYRATIAHTAALAIGWSVPGCAMIWGGECTCGDGCKCVGCPKHNPLSQNNHDSAIS